MDASLESQFPESARTYQPLGSTPHLRLVHVRWPVWNTNPATNDAAQALPTALRQRCHIGTQGR